MPLPGSRRDRDDSGRRMVSRTDSQTAESEEGHGREAHGPKGSSVGAGRPVSDSGSAANPMTPKAAKPTTETAAQGDVLTTLPAAMTGRASPAKAAVGDKPVFAYIGSLPAPQRAIAERVDALAAETLLGLQRSVKWGMAWYGVGDGW